MATLEFTKMHGCGNDYIYVVADRARPADPVGAVGQAFRSPLRHRRRRPDHARAVEQAPTCEWRCTTPTAAAARCAATESDASRGSPSSAASCAANPIVVETDCGLKTVALQLEGGRVIERDRRYGRADSRRPRNPGRRGRPNHRLSARGRRPPRIGSPRSRWAIRIASCSSTTTASSSSQDRDFAALGREFEHHPFFPRRVNTEFILPLSRDQLKMRVWERGSGETLACGTGACAALVAAVLTGSGRADARRSSCAAAILKSNGVPTAPMRITCS